MTMQQDFSMESARLHAKLVSHRRAVQRAQDRVRQALATAPGTWAAATSGGKDSTAMLDIAVSAGWRGPLFFFEYRETPPENRQQIEALAARYGLGVEAITVTGAFDVFDRVGYFFASASTEKEAAAVRWMERAYKREASEHQAKAGWAGVLIGMRAQESQRRRRMFGQKGWLYTTRDRPLWTCCPLYDWSARDVWGRIASQGLPYLARYDDTDDRLWRRSEETWLAMDCWRNGMAADMKRRDPERWQELAARYPEIEAEL